MPINAPESNRLNGLPYALAANLIWGLMPIYLRALRTVSPYEFVGWRLVFTLPVCLLFIAVSGHGRGMLAVLTNTRAIGMLLVGALLIGGNWLIYVAAIQNGHVFATSLGYYIIPLMNVLAGTLFLGERLSWMQWAAVVMAGLGVSILAWSAFEMVAIALVLAITFTGYGLVRRFAPVGAVAGLAIETGLLFVPAIGLLVWYEHGPGLSFGHNTHVNLLLAASGVITAAGLSLFTIAARRMDYSTLGFSQYLSPTIVFFIGIFVFHEKLRILQLTCFVIIWVSVALYVWDIFRRRDVH